MALSPVPYTIISARPEHVDLVAPLFDLYRQFYRESSDLEGARQFLRQRLDRKESVIFLALEGARGVGFTQLYPSFSSTAMKRLWILNDLFVTPDTRSHGIGRALLERARQFAHETGAIGLELATAIDNLTAQRLYEKTGWKRDEEFYHYSLAIRGARV
jgi:GNAT superfamily N-acetyltransferase